jgi:hypothetical protein
MVRTSAPVAVVLAVLWSSGCGSTDAAGVTAPGSATQPRGPEATARALPDHVEVECSPRRISLSTGRAAAQAAGVVLVVSSTMPAGTYLSYVSDGAGSFAGGEPVPRRPTTWALPLAPGAITLACSADGEADLRHTATLRISDPGGFWRGESLDHVGCGSSAGQPSWAADLSGRGSTAEQAVRQTLNAFEALARSQHRSTRYTARPAEIGYREAATQTWVAFASGRAALTIDVTHEQDHYSAFPNHLCGD